MKLCQRCLNLIKSANGQHVPVSHLVAVTKAEWYEVVNVCNKLVLHYWV